MAYGLQVRDNGGKLTLDTSTKVLRIAKIITVSRSGGGSVYTYPIGGGITQANAYVISPKGDMTDLKAIMEQGELLGTSTYIDITINSSNQLAVDATHWPNDVAINLIVYIFFKG